MDNFDISLDIPVQWGDMDAAQHVNNVIYLKWVEAGRIRFFFKLNSDRLIRLDDIGPIVAWQDCKYIRPVNYPDTVIVKVRKKEILEDRLVLETRIFSKEENQIVAISNQQIMPYNYKTKSKAPIPLDWIYNT